MVQNATLKEVEDGYAIVAHEGSRVLGETLLEDKADIVLMIPVESLLILVSHRLHMPYAGFDGIGFRPGMGIQEAVKPQEPSAQQLSCDKYGPFIASGGAL